MIFSLMHLYQRYVIELISIWR